MEEVMLMSAQTGGHPHGEQPINRYFFAIVPETDAASDVDRIARHMRRSKQLRGKIIGIDRYHISLCGIGAPGAAPSQILSALGRIGNETSGGHFDVGFDHAVSFGNNARRRRRLPRPVVLARSESMPALNLLQSRLRQRMADHGLPTQRQFNPHVTLLYDEQEVVETGIPPLRWTVRDFVLIHSIHGEGHHRHLARWSLGSAPRLGSA